MIVSSAEFVKSSQELNQCPQPDMPEFAFIGRSNVGKSSLINMLVDKKDLAKTSSQPGKTQLINHFLINEEWYLVDLPGYGYAKTSMENRKKWRKMIEDYLLKRVNLLTVFVLVDSRLEPQKIDLEFINFLGENQVPITLLFTKIDKQSAKKTEESLERFKESLSEYWEELPKIILTSSEKRVGRDEVLETIENIIPFFNQENE
ncbi:MAG: YihA family ribosome biogenesis GTP-binding protein [Bacteroidales bacterium]|nr:YihA family ribosome biogenesis GTP-binding protein [Bacteroidales bacterium]MBO7228763.1 YihA family ribosome biogenesis GTP-binding protein [Bacteroidales bacterium]